MEHFENQNSAPMTVKDWLLTMIICAIPLVGLIMLFVYAFGNNGNPNKRNWAKAQLIFVAIAFVLAIICFIMFGAFFAAAAMSDQPDGF